MKTTIETTTFRNHFESAFTLVAGSIAFDSGCHTWHDDEGVEAEIETELITKGIIRVFNRYGDSRESDVVPNYLRYVGFREFMSLVRGVEITIHPTH